MLYYITTVAVTILTMVAYCAPMYFIYLGKWPFIEQYRSDPVPAL